jgi:hypothetical protein
MENQNNLLSPLNKGVPPGAYNFNEREKSGCGMKELKAMGWWVVWVVLLVGGIVPNKCIERSYWECLFTRGKLGNFSC